MIILLGKFEEIAKMRISSFGPYIFTILIYTLLMLPVLIEERQIFLPSVGDQPVGFYPVQSGSSIFSAWGVDNLGTPVENGSGKYLMFVLQSILHSTFLTQLIIYFGLFVLASIGFILVFKQLGFVKNPYLVFPIALSLTLNWVLFQTLQLFEIGTTASFPFLLLFGVRALNGLGKMRWNILGITLGLLIATSFSNVAGFGSAMFVMFPIVLAKILSVRKTRDLIPVVRGILGVLSSIAIATGIALPFFYQGFYLLLSGGFHSYVSVSSGGSLTNSTPLDLLQYMHTLMPSYLSPFIIAASPMFDNAFWPLGLFIVFLAVIALFNRNEIQRSLSMSYMLVIIGMIALIYAILENQTIVNVLYGKIPLLYVLIEAQNYGYIMLPIWIILAGLGIATIEQYCASLSRKSTLLVQILTLLIAVMIALSTVSAFNFSPVNFSSVYQTPLNINGNPFPAQPPQPILDLFLTMQQQRSVQGPFRVLWLPYPLWLTQLFYAQPTADVLNIHTLGNQIERATVISTLSKFVTGNTTDLAAQLASLDFKYIVVPLFFNDSNSISF